MNKKTTRRGLIIFLIMVTLIVVIPLRYESKINSLEKNHETNLLELETENKKLESELNYFKLCTLDVVTCDFEKDLERFQQ